MALYRIGEIVQSVRTDDGEVATGSTIIPVDDTIPQSTEGDEYITVTITPKNATNKLIIEAQLFLYHTGTNARVVMALFKDSETDARTAVYKRTDTGGNVFPSPQNICYEMVAGGTSAITFKIRAGGSIAGTTTFNGNAGARRLGGVMNSFIQVTEVAQ